MPAGCRHVRTCALVLAALLAGCARTPPQHVRLDWVAVAPTPRFAPGAWPTPARVALERMLTRGLVDEDADGRIVAAAAARWRWSADACTLTVTMRRGLAFTDGAPCTSRDAARTLRAALQGAAAVDHAWLLRAVAGIDPERVARGRPSSPAITTPDDTTLVITLARADSLLLRSLTLPAFALWSPHAADWSSAAGLGPWRIASSAPDRMTLVPGGALAPVRTVTRGRDAAARAPDTVAIRFAGSARALALLRDGRADLVWPASPAIAAADLPPGARRAQAPCAPARWLMLVMRHDRLPTARGEVRQWLARSVRLAQLRQALGPAAATGALPSRDGAATPSPEPEMAPRPFHAAMSFDADGEAAGVARVLQGEWSRSGCDIELHPVRGGTPAGGWPGPGAELALVSWAPPLEGPASTVAAAVAPPRGPALGGLDTGWRDRQLSAWAAGYLTAPPAAAAAVDAEGVAVPLAGLAWWWVQREDFDVPVHPRFGPEAGSATTTGRPER